MRMVMEVRKTKKNKQTTKKSKITKKNQKKKPQVITHIHKELEDL